MLLIFGSGNAWAMFLLSNVPDWLLKLLRVRITDTDAAAYFKDLVQHTIKMRKDEERQNDLLQLLLDAREKNVETSGKGLSEVEVISNAIMFFAGGFDTTKSTVSLVIWRLAINPSVQDNVYEEIQTLLGDRSLEDLNYDDYVKLEYLEAVVHETLRMTSIDCRGMRFSTCETTLPLTDIKLPQYTFIAIPFWPIHYDERNFKNPKEFQPERFMENGKTKIKGVTYLAFGAVSIFCLFATFLIDCYNVYFCFRDHANVLECALRC